MQYKIYDISEKIKEYARLVTAQAQDKGFLPKPERCQICGYDREMLAEEKAGKTVWGYDSNSELWLLDSHHPNYYQPFNIWHLCRKCHKRLHKIQIKYQMAILHLDLAKKLIFQSSNSGPMKV